MKMPTPLIARQIEKLAAAKPGDEGYEKRFKLTVRLAKNFMDLTADEAARYVEYEATGTITEAL